MKIAKIMWTLRMRMIGGHAEKRMGESVLTEKEPLRMIFGISIDGVVRCFVYGVWVFFTRASVLGRGQAGIGETGIS